MMENREKEVMDQIVHLCETTPLNIEAVMDIVEVSARLYTYGVFNLPELLDGLYGGDFHELSDEDKLDRLKKSNELVHFSTFWNRCMKAGL